MLHTASRPFGPLAIAALYDAYHAALAEIVQGDDRTDGIPAREIRRRLAAGVIAAAQEGVVDGEDLKRAGIAALRPE